MFLFVFSYIRYFICCFILSYRSVLKSIFLVLSFAVYPFLYLRISKKWDFPKDGHGVSNNSYNLFSNIINIYALNRLVYYLILSIDFLSIALAKRRKGSERGKWVVVFSTVPYQTIGLSDNPAVNVMYICHIHQSITIGATVIY